MVGKHKRIRLGNDTMDTISRGSNTELRTVQGKKIFTIPEFTKERFLSRVAKARALVPLRKKFALIYFLYIFSSTYRCTLFLTFLRSHLFALSVHMFIVYVY